VWAHGSCNGPSTKRGATRRHASGCTPARSTTPAPCPTTSAPASRSTKKKSSNETCSFRLPGGCSHFARLGFSRNDLLHQAAVHVGQPKIAAGVVERESRVIEAE